MNHCFDHKMLFTITADQDRAVKEVIKQVKEWKPFDGIGRQERRSIL